MEPEAIVAVLMLVWFAVGNVQKRATDHVMLFTLTNHDRAKRKFYRANQEQPIKLNLSSPDMIMHHQIPQVLPTELQEHRIELRGYFVSTKQGSLFNNWGSFPNSPASPAAGEGLCYRPRTTPAPWFWGGFSFRQRTLRVTDDHSVTRVRLWQTPHDSQLCGREWHSFNHQGYSNVYGKLETGDFF